MNRTRLEMEQLRAEIMRCIAANDGLSGSDIVRKIGAAPSTIQYNLKMLTRAGRLDCIETRYKHFYSLPKHARKV